MDFYEMRKFVAPEFIFGVGALGRTGHYARHLNAQRILVVTDPGLIEAGWVAPLVDSLTDLDLKVSLFKDISPNPRDHQVMAGARFYREHSCDVIVAIGGGSVLDCAKGIGIVVSNGGHILDYEGVDKIPLPCPPLICIPTTSGTSADISQFAIINATERRCKIAIISKSVVPDVALIDPLTTTTLPRYLTACTGIDALTHAVEAYVSTASSPFVDVHALAAIELVAQNLLKTLRDPGDTRACENMSLASLHAGLAFSNASLGAVHAMAHSLGGYLDLPHGESNALLLEHVVRFNFPLAEERYRRIGQALGIDASRMAKSAEAQDRISQTLHDLREAAGIVGGLAARSVTRSIIEELAPHATHDACLFTNPRRANLADIKAIYAEAL